MVLTEFLSWRIEIWRCDSKIQNSYTLKKMLKNVTSWLLFKINSRIQIWGRKSQKIKFWKFYVISTFTWNSAGSKWKIERSDYNFESLYIYYNFQSSKSTFFVMWLDKPPRTRLLWKSRFNKIFKVEAHFYNFLILTHTTLCY